MRFGYRAIVALGAAALVGGCAPDAWNAQPGFDGFLNQIGQQCYPMRIGMTLVSDLVDNPAPYFIDETSRLYYGKISAENYRSAITSFSDDSAGTNRAIDCILSKLPSSPPAAPGMTPFSRPTGAAPGDGVPPPPPSR
jgi:hypothetical protein